METHGKEVKFVKLATRGPTHEVKLFGSAATNSQGGNMGVEMGIFKDIEWEILSQ